MTRGAMIVAVVVMMFSVAAHAEPQPKPPRAGGSCPARSREAVCDAIGELLETYTRHECANYLRNSGYGAT